jgi:hypothetical protein
MPHPAGSPDHPDYWGQAAMPTQGSIERIEKLVRIYTEKSGTTTHPNNTITDAVFKA